LTLSVSLQEVDPSCTNPKDYFRVTWFLASCMLGSDAVPHAGENYIIY